MNKNLVKIDKIYRYDFSDDELVRGCDCIGLSEDVEFYADCVIFPATATLVRVIEVEGRVVEYPDSFKIVRSFKSIKSSKSVKSRKARLRIELADPVPIKLIRRGEITAGELLRCAWKRYEIVTKLGKKVGYGGLKRLV
jgi:hypothetical protein